MNLKQFANDDPFPTEFNLSDLNGSNGFVINGIDLGDNSGSSVSNAGDINGDGIDDLIIGAPSADPNGNDRGGESYVIFGRNNVGSSGTFELSALDGSNGFVINGIDELDISGISVSNGGDINDDGIDDLIIGARGADANGNDEAGQSYVVFGGSHVGSSGTFELSALDGSNGFILNGINEFDFSGYSVSNGGDINGDGIDDLIIGAFFADPNGIVSGESYVVFGGSHVGSSGTIELSELDGSNGFVLNGIAEFDSSGRSVSNAGDVNADGIDDLIIGADAGQSYVVFGGSYVGSSGTLELSNLNGSNGFIINGINIDSFSGRPVSNGGDINSDGIDDLIIGASFVDPNGNQDAGESYVIFGDSNVGSSGTLELSALDGSNGFVINGIDPGDNSGASVSNAGDINDDGFDDLIIGAPGADGIAGQTYVVFGFNTINGTPDDDRLLGTFSRDHINGFDGNDIIIGRAGDDTIDSGADRDILFGNDGYDSLLGGDGRDFLVGGRDNDLLDGGSGNDSLTGGLDADQFLLREGDGQDSIFDYRDGTDFFLLADGLAFEDLTIPQCFGQTVISVTETSEDLASLLGVNANDIGAEDFSVVISM